MKDNTLTPTVVGIDIGTFTTKISAVQRGVIDAVINEANFRETPSVVGFGQGQRKIGQLGSVKLKSNFKNTVVSPTRYLGLNGQNQQVEGQLANCPCPNKFEGDELYFKVNFNGIDESFTTQQILAAYMTKLSSIINHNDLDPRMIVFSVPSCFTQSEKKSILSAAEISGMKNVRLATQAVCIGLDYGSFKKSDMGEGKYVVFIDFGYYQLSLSLIKFTQSTMQIISERSNRNLGCRDIDQKIFNYIGRKFEQKKGLNLKQSKRACLKLLEAIQRQRKILSGIAETQISIQCLFEDEDLSQPFTREIMITEAGQVFNSIADMLKDFKEQIQKRNIKIDSVQLIGGGSRIPKFIEQVEQAFNMSASRTTNSSQTISRGATLAAVQYSGMFRFDTFSITNKCLNGIVLSWKDLQNNTQDPALNYQKIIQTNEVIPCEKSLKIEAEGNLQIVISYDILDQAIEKKIARIVLQGSNKKNIILNFSIDGDGFIKLLSAKDEQDKDAKYTISYFRQISPQKMLGYKAKQREMFVKDFSIVKLHQKRNQLESFIYKQKQIINSQQFKKYVSAEQNQKAKQYLLQISENIQSQDKQLGIKEYDQKKKQIQQEIAKLFQSAKKKKLQIEEHFKQLEKLKNYASDAMKQISQKFRKSKPVIECYQAIKQIQQWAEDAIKITKTKNIHQIPVVSKQDIQNQYENIKTLVDQLVNPPQPKPQPRHQHFQSHYDPNEYMRKSWFGPQNFRNDDDEQYQRERQAKLRKQQLQRQRERQEPFYQGFGYPQNQFFQPQSQRSRYAQEQELLRRQEQQEQARRRQQQQRQYDPFGSRSGLFGPSSNNFFRGFF